MYNFNLSQHAKEIFCGWCGSKNQYFHFGFIKFKIPITVKGRNLLANRRNQGQRYKLGSEQEEINMEQ